MAEYMKLIKSTLVLLVLLLLFFSCRSYIGSEAINNRIKELREKYPPPNLTKSQLYEDFDTLVSIMERCNPQYLVRKKVTGYDLVAEIKAQRKLIEECENTLDFIRLLKNCLVLSLDGHCFIGNNVWFFKHSFYKNNIKINGIKNSDFGINFHYIHDVFYVYPPKIDLIYIQGNYFLKNKTTFFNDLDSIVLLPCTEILYFNAQPILTYQDSAKTMGTRWDFNIKVHSNSELWLPDNQNSIGFKMNDKVTEYTFTSLSAIEDDVMKRIREKKFQAKYFEKDSAIYITVPLMTNSTVWLGNLKSELLLFF